MPIEYEMTHFTGVSRNLLILSNYNYRLLHLYIKCTRTRPAVTTGRGENYKRLKQVKREEKYQR